MFLITSSIQSATWGWASTQIGCNVDVDNALCYTSGTTIYIKESSLPPGKIPIINQYVSFIYYTKGITGMPMITAVGTASGGYIPCTLNVSQGNIGSSINPVSVDIYSLNARPLDNTFVAGPTTGSLGFSTLAPNGLIYTPINVTGNTSTTDYYTALLVIDPGQSNHKTIDGSIQYSYSRTNMYIVKADGTPNRPNTTNNLVNVNRDRFHTKGVLAPNGLIYFIPGRATEMLVLNPGTGIVAGAPDCTWQLINLNTTTPVVRLPTGSICTSGGVLDKLNGDIYGINGGVTGQPNFRIRPRSSTTWTNPNNASTTTDIFQVGYWTGVPPKRLLTNSSLAVAANFDQDANGSAFRGGIIDPNPSSNLIYITPGYYNQIAIIDPNQWNTVNEYSIRPNTVLDTMTDIPTWNNTNTASNGNMKYSAVSLNSNGTLNYNFSGTTYTLAANGPYVPTVGWNIIVNTNYSNTNQFTSTKMINSLGQRANNQISTFITTGLNCRLLSGAVIPNGSNLFFSLSPCNFVGNYSPPYPKYATIYQLRENETDIKAYAPNSTTTPDSHIRFLPSKSSDKINYTTFAGSNGIQSSLITITKPSAIGKVIVGSRSFSENPIELIAVKGFYVGVTNFEYDVDTMNKISIPSNLSTLPSHPYNYYGNWT